MRTSEQINEIATALAKAQGMLKPASKDSENPAYRSRYADLTSVWAAWHAAGPDFGLAIMQDVTTEEAGVSVVTRLTHTSGQWFEFGPLVIPMARKDAHGIGSATSYAKRYGLSAAVGIVADDDDDGNAAQGPPQGKGAQREARQTEQRRVSADSGPYAERERAKIDTATGEVLPLEPPPTASDWPALQERMKKWPPEIAAIIPPDEAIFLMPEPEAESNRAMYCDGIRDIAKRRKLSQMEVSDLRAMFFPTRATKLEHANIYILRALWKYLEPDRA